MPDQLDVAIGQFSSKGRKPTNQDFHGACLPGQPLRTTKGIPVGLADGISSSDVSQVASETVVKAFLDDYFCTSEAWSVKHSVYQVLTATNYWLHSMTRQSQYRYDQDKGYVCTFSGIVFKSTTAHLFHIGDTRIYRMRGEKIKLLTSDHRLRVSQDTSYLTRAMGFRDELEIDYQTIAVEQGDVFFLLTDGVYEFADDDCLRQAVAQHAADLDAAAKQIVTHALDHDSDDNVTAQIVRIESVPRQSLDEAFQKLTELPFPPELIPRMEFEGYKVIRELYASSRSHVYLVTDLETEQPFALKTLSVEQQNDPAHLDRFLTEEWIARRLNHANVLKAFPSNRQRHSLYTITEFIEGQTLTQWMIDNPNPNLETVRSIVEQIGKGLQAFHRLEMLHQDLRPENIMIDAQGTAKIIDFGSTWVAGLAERTTPIQRDHALGTVQYMAPEYLLGQSGTSRSDVFSLGVIAYQMLTGRLPYGSKLARARTRSAQNKLNYETAMDVEREIPVWIDGALKKAVQINPNRRYEEPSEFVYDLRHPRKEFLRDGQPLLLRDPAAYWKRVALTLLFLLITVCFAWIITG
ncbi:bifunctional protein-serine/threonine kinase/phosphatase [Stieleria sp. TO1_6]|nr:bifunctional protein-serine/threonine kinase/phosphatase [Stieleria tagensis]